MNISFGKKITIAKCHILDKEQNKFVPVVINEYDCTTMDDFVEVQKLGATFLFATTISQNMYAKNNSYYTKQPNNNRFFNIERENNGEVLGLALCEEQKHSLDVGYIETKHDNRHRYTGQALLASLAGFSSAIGKFKIKIKNAVKTSVDFYQDTCGFDKNSNSEFQLMRRDIPNFLEQTEERTKHPIINLQG